MDITKLKEGMVVKSYKELCKTLEVKEKTSNSRKKQLEDFKRYFDYTREKYTFIINKIYEFPKALTIDQHLENFLLVNLIKSYKKNNHFVLFGTKATYYSMLALVNENYRKYAYNPIAMSKEFDIDESNAIELCNILNNTLSYKFKSLIKRLENNKIILTEEVYMACTINKDGEYIYKQTDNDEKEKYMKICSKAIKKLKCQDFQEVYKENKLLEYNEFVAESLKKELGVNYIFKCYKIFFHKEFISNRLERVYKQFNMTEEQIQYEIELINQSFSKKMIDNGENRSKKALSKTEYIQEYIEFNEIFDKKTNILINRSKKSYMEDVDKFVAALIQITGLKTLQEMKNMFENKKLSKIVE